LVPRDPRDLGRDHPGETSGCSRDDPSRCLGSLRDLRFCGAHPRSVDSINGVSEFARYPSIPWNTQEYPGVYASRYPLGIQGIRCRTPGYSQRGATNRRRIACCRVYRSHGVPIWDCIYHRFQCDAIPMEKSSFIRRSKLSAGQADQSLASLSKGIFVIRRSKNFHRELRRMPN